MDIIVSLITVSVTIIGALIGLGVTLGNLKGRLDTLEGKKHFERAEQEFTHKLEVMLDSAQKKLEGKLSPQTVLHDVEVSKRHAIQQIEQVLGMSNLSDLKRALQELETAKQRALEEIGQASSLAQLTELERDINQSLEEFRVKIADMINRADVSRLALEHDIEQSLVKIQKQFTELEQQREKITSEIAKRIRNDAFKALKQDIDKLKQSVVQPSDPVIALAETLPEISFETAFIDSNKKIRRETRKARQLVENLGNGVILEMIYIPGGTFMMGTNDYDSEKPIHSVTINPFFAGKYPVTQAQWEAVMGDNRSMFQGSTRPVEMVSWNDVMKFCAELSQMTGHFYRLLSEAQWEYVCRAGSTTKYSFGDVITPDLANYNDSGIGQTTPVGKYPPNAFGLYDIHGNVWEWCEDVWHENYVGASTDGSAWMSRGDSNLSLLRGGSWNYDDDRLRCAYRFGCGAAFKNSDWGFRLSRM